MKVAILGAAGRMGQMLCKLGDANPDMEIVAKCDIADGFDKDWPADTDAVIDFTFHSAVPANIAKAVETNSAFVLGTTGLTAEEEKAVADASAKIPVVKSANMSLGVNLLLELVRKAASVLGNEYDIEVVEMHHRHKKDAPSGTAEKLLAVVEAARGLDKSAERHGRSGLVGERTRNEIGVHALRGGSVVGDHTVIFAGEGERVELTHKAESRAIFANGAVHAASWVVGKAPAVYGMDAVLGLTD